MVFDATAKGCKETRIFAADTELKQKLTSGKHKVHFEFGEGSRSFKQEMDCWKAQGGRQWNW